MTARFLALATLLALQGVQVPDASACTFSWKRGWSPDEIKTRYDVREVRGTFRLAELTGRRFTDEEGVQWIQNGIYEGTIEPRRGKPWRTFHPAPDMRTTCYAGTYFKPTADARGTFWISRKKVDGRYQILLWEGEYIPAQNAENHIESDI